MTRDELETIIYQHMPRVGSETLLHYNVQSILAAVDQYVITVADPETQRAILQRSADRVHGRAGGTSGQTWRQQGRRREPQS